MPAAESGSSAPPSTMLGAVSPEPTARRAADPAADPGSGSDAEPSPPRKKPEPKLCGLCGTQPGKYKCPRCSMPYCSVACSKQHKENHPPDPPKPEPSPTPNNIAQPDPTQDDPYSILLEHRDTFQHLFAKYPSLTAELTRIQATTLPPSETASGIAGLGGGAANTANTGRNRQQQQASWQPREPANTGRNRQQPWTRDVGLRRGAEALRKARTDPSDTGDGVREFCELVKFLLNKKREGIERVREEVVAEETRYIERLMREEEG
ncbi:hypothetical protein C8A01DRAFT_48241 [Parachaetomium inaequale]|uniref:HIT-type domain-containing protein n=1 Tax=Parachaetomium inaequale TaxID=2588326 RepID=A0AAN6SQ74_9PEZI|nr:hypothetical protein C8A01DRAFT_48241 [Parachaetomium inaequale]